MRRESFLLFRAIWPPEQLAELILLVESRKINALTAKRLIKERIDRTMERLVHPQDSPEMA